METGNAPGVQNLPSSKNMQNVSRPVNSRDEVGAAGQDQQEKTMTVPTNVQTIQEAFLQGGGI
jgi:hypothetical protein